MGLTACLWFDDQAEDAAALYTTVLRDGKIGKTILYDEVSGGPGGKEPGSVMVVEFEAEGQKFLALNGGPQFSFDEAISFVVERDTQEELDAVCDALIDGGGEQGPCGWLKDRFGVSWQVIPSMWGDVMSGDPEVRRRMTEALFSMRRIDIAALERAREGVTSSAN